MLNLRHCLLAVQERRLQLPPRPPDIAKSLRGLGYSPQTAIADLIDNSIAAGAAAVRIGFLWDAAAPKIKILDNGTGMSGPELLEAMRLGRDPGAVRSKSDLGRFGLGLKTASLSQAKSLTVCAKQAAGEVAVARWDIDHIEAAGEWELQVDHSAEAAPVVAELAAQASGTLVLWEKLDRLLEASGGSIDGFLQVADGVGQHLGMVFHRFLSSGRLTISINGDPVTPWDPFMADHPDCRRSGPETIEDGKRRHSVMFTGYVLPPEPRLTRDEFDGGAGPLGWIAQQGFYVYRQDRLIFGGGWLGLGRAGHPWKADRNHSLARISLDITNASDLEWSIDLLKSQAIAPATFRAHLLHLAQEMRRRAKSAFRVFAGPANGPLRKSDDGDTPIWLPKGDGAAAQLRINRRHPLVIEARRSMRKPALMRSLLDHLDRYTPMHPMASAIPQADGGDQQSIKKLVRSVYYTLRKGQGLSAAEARDQLLQQATFRQHEALVIVSVEEYEQELAR